MTEEISYLVFTAEYFGRPNHIAIFVETEPDDDGRIFNVTGDILNGMTYEARPSSNPIHTLSYVLGTLTRIGTVMQQDMPRFEEACEAVEVPEAQLFLNGKPKDPSKPVRRCGEWVEDAKVKLIADGILKLGVQLPESGK